MEGRGFNPAENQMGHVPLPLVLPHPRNPRLATLTFVRAFRV
jgi:hypothetical protein